MSNVAPSPEQGQLVSVRSRQWIVSEVARSKLPAERLQTGLESPQHLITLSSVKDDGLGEELSVIWELEPGARVVERVALPDPTGFDLPDWLDAFLDAVRWGRNLQAHFRFGIKIECASPGLFAVEELLPRPCGWCTKRPQNVPERTLAEGRVRLERADGTELMSVAERFKSARIADLPIQPSAAYLKAAPSAPDKARQSAIEKAEAGEEITFATAKEIVADAKKKKRPRRQKAVPADKLGVRLIKMMRRYQERWPGEPAELAQRLRGLLVAWTCRDGRSRRGGSASDVAW